MVGEECEPSLTTPMCLSQWSVFHRCLTFNSCLISQVFILIAKVRCSPAIPAPGGVANDFGRMNCECRIEKGEGAIVPGSADTLK